MAETHDPMVDPEAQLLPRQAPPPVTRLNKKVVRGAIGGLGFVTAAILFFSPDLTSWMQRDESPVEAALPTNEPPPVALNNMLSRYAEQAPPPPEIPQVVPPPAAVPPPTTNAPRTQGRAPSQRKQRTSLLPAGAPDVARELPKYLSAAMASASAEAQAEAGKFTNKGTVVPPPGRYAVMQGNTIPVLLLTQPNSDICGDFLARVSEPVYDTRTGQYLLVPQGTMVVGKYECDPDYGDRLIPLASTRLIFPNTSSMAFDDNFPLTSPSGTPGAEGKVNNHWGRVIFAVLASAVLNTGTRYAAGTVGGDRGVAPHQDFALQAGQGFDRAADRILQRELNVDPTIKTYQGQRALVFLQKDLVFEQPYQN